MREEGQMSRPPDDGGSAFPRACGMTTEDAALPEDTSCTNPPRLMLRTLGGGRGRSVQISIASKDCDGFFDSIILEQDEVAEVAKWLSQWTDAVPKG
jgi:hypothetical protein